MINGSLGIDYAFTPIPALNHPDADITLVFLSANQIVYPLPVRLESCRNVEIVANFRRS